MQEILLFKDIQENNYYECYGDYLFITKVEDISGQIRITMFARSPEESNWDGPNIDEGQPDNKYGYGQKVPYDDYNCPEYPGYPRSKPSYPRLILRTEGGSTFTVCTDLPLKGG